MACSYFAKAQPCGSDFTHRNRTQVNTRLLLSSFFSPAFMFESRLAFAIGNFRPYLSKFVLQHVAAAVRLMQQSASRGKRKANPVYGKETENGKTPGSEQPVVKSVCGSLTMRRRAALAIIVCRWMHNLQVGGN